MDRYIGLDAHLGSCTLAVMGPSGRKLREGRVDTDAKTLVDFICGIAGERHLCLEEGMLSEWLYEILEPHVAELVVVQPAASHGSKSDSLDAWSRAEELRVGATHRSVFKAPGRYRALREAVRIYDSVTQDQARIKQRLRALYSSRGLQGAGVEIFDPCRRRPWLAKLPPARRRRGKLLSDELDHLADVYEDAVRWLTEEAMRTPAVVLLSSAPGIGVVRGSQIVAQVVTPHRFRTKRQFWSYCGLGIVMRSSSDWKQSQGEWQRRSTRQTRGLNKQCNRSLKNAFKGAVQSIITMRDDPFGRAYHSLIAEGRKPNLVKLTIARRLAACVLAMWRNEEIYDPAKLTSQPAPG